MSIFNRARELAQQNAETAHDMHDVSSGGGGGRVLETGEYYGYLCSYVETGTHPDEFQGEHKGDFPNFRWGVAIFHDEDESNPDAYEIIRPFFSTAIKSNEKSGSTKIFRGLNVENDPAIKTIAEFLGVPRRFKVTKTESKKKKGTFFNDIDWAATGLAAEGVGRNRKLIELPDIKPEHVQVFFWDYPTVEDWEALFIEKRNFIQNEIMNALNFDGSPLDILLADAGIALPDMDAEEPEDEAPATGGGVLPDEEAGQDQSGKSAQTAGRPSRPVTSPSATAPSATTSPSKPTAPARVPRPRATRA